MNIFDHVTNIGNRVYIEFVVFILILLTYINLTFFLVFDKNMIPFFLLFDLFTTPILLFHFYRSLKLRRGLDLGQSNNVIFAIEIFSCLPFFLIIHYYSLSEWFLLFYFLRIISKYK